MEISKILKKALWLTEGKIAEIKHPIKNDMFFVGVTGTDGKTTTSNYIYELAKSQGFIPLVITTVGVKFKNKYHKVNLSSGSFISFSIKNAFNGIKEGDLKKLFRNIFFRDKFTYLNESKEHRTTPLASEIRKLIQKYQNKGANFIILEVTSHALDQHRVYGIKFDVAVYTNITNEHLDYHGNWTNYAKAKSKLINHLKQYASVVLNYDDRKSYNFILKKFNRIANRKHLSLYSYKTKNFKIINESKFIIKSEQINSNKFEVVASPTIDTDKEESNIKLNLFGKYNIYNALAAYSAFTSLKSEVNIASFNKAFEEVKELKGRMNFLNENPIIIVDFAHTPNALKQALISLQKLRNKRSKIWTIFGCAGLRDFYKRPAMGKIAFDYSDNILITSEDPRTESLYEINNQIIRGFESEPIEFTINTYYPEIKYKDVKSKNIYRFDEPNINSRRNAIQFAIKNAGREGIIAIFGKGHEKTICFGTKEYNWNDIDEVTNFLSEQ